MLFICLLLDSVHLFCHASSILCLGQHFAGHRGGRQNYGPGNNQGHKVAVESYLVVAWPLCVEITICF